MKKTTQYAIYLLLFVVSVFVVGYFFGDNSALSFGLNILFFLLIMSGGRFNQKRLDQKLDEMWRLADQLGMDETQLAKLSDLGSMDLAATKPGQRTYWPFARQINQTITKLQKIAAEKQTAVKHS